MYLIKIVIKIALKTFIYILFYLLYIFFIFIYILLLYIFFILQFTDILPKSNEI